MTRLTRIASATAVALLTLLATAGLAPATAGADPAARAAATGWRYIGTSGYFSCGVKQNGTLWCWGHNGDGELGVGGRRGRRLATRVGTGHNWRSVSLGNSHACGIRGTGTLWCWGSSDWGQLGTGTTRTQRTPVRIGDGADWTLVAAGADRTCGLRDPGTAWCWGYNEGGVGDGTRQQRNEPTQVGDANDWTTIGTGAMGSCGLRGPGTLWCWGAKTLGVSATPTRFGKVTWRWTRLSLNWLSCGIRKDQSLWCWGDNNYGGVGPRSAPRTLRTPTAVGSPSVNWRDAAGGGTGGCAVRTDGSNWCWGYNEEGRVGDGTAGPDKTRPARTSGAANWLTSSAGPFNTCGVRRDGSGWCWGSNHFNQIGDGTDVTRLTPVRVRQH